MRNQIRAAFYLLGRSATLKAAFAVVTLYPVVVLANDLMAEAEAASQYWIMDFPKIALMSLLLMGPVLAASFAASDQENGAARNVCLAEKGRRDYVVSRFVVLYAAIAALVVWAFAWGLVLSAVGSALGLPMIKDLMLQDLQAWSYPAGLVARCLGYSALALALTWAARGRGRGAAWLAAFVVVAGVPYWLLSKAVSGVVGWVASNFFHDNLADVYVAIMQALSISYSAGTIVDTIGYLRTFALAAIYVAAALGLGLKLWARRTV